jgi:hypothetical protein
MVVERKTIGLATKNTNYRVIWALLIVWGLLELYLYVIFKSWLDLNCTNTHLVSICLLWYIPTYCTSYLITRNGFQSVGTRQVLVLYRNLTFMNPCNLNSISGYHSALHDKYCTMGQYKNLVWTPALTKYTGYPVRVLSTTRKQALKYRYRSLLRAQQENKGSAHMLNMFPTVVLACPTHKPPSSCAINSCLILIDLDLKESSSTFSIDIYSSLSTLFQCFSLSALFHNLVLQSSVYCPPDLRGDRCGCLWILWWWWWTLLLCFNSISLLQYQER